MFYPFLSKIKPKQNENIKNNNKDNNCINMIKESIKNESNEYCVECGEPNPKYISINNSIFLCSKCILNHLQLSQEASTIIKNDLKILTLNEIQYIYNGGNKKLLEFIDNEFPKLKKFPPHILYNTKAMDYYRKNLKYLTEGGNAPIKPSLKEAYTIIKKDEEKDIIDNNMYKEVHNFDDYNDDEIDNDINDIKYNENGRYKINYNNNYNYYRFCNTNEKNQTKKSDKQFNENTFINTYPNRVKNFSFSKNNHRKNEKENDNSKFEKDNFNIKICESVKSIKFKNNYSNFDNENFCYNTIKTSDTINLYNSVDLNKIKDNKSKDYLIIKNEFLSPQTTLTNTKNSNSDIKVVNNVYSRPKAASFFQKYKYRIKSDTLGIKTKNNDSNNHDKINISEFKVEDSKGNFLDGKNKKEVNNNDKIKINRTRNNNFYNTKKAPNDNKEENKTKNKTFQNRREILKMDSAKSLRYNKASKLDINNGKIKKEKEENSAHKKENDSNPHISVNIAHYKIIKNVNNYNINIGNPKNDKNEMEKSEKITRTDSYFHQKIEKKNSDFTRSSKLFSDIVSIPKPKTKTKRDELKIEKNELKKENSQRNSDKRLFDFKKNKTEDENETKKYNRNSLRDCRTFVMRNSQKIERNNFKNNQNLLSNNNSIEKKSYSFYKLRARYKSKEKEKKDSEKKEEIKNIEKKNITIMADKYNGKTINESIRNKYKKKRLKNLNKE